MLVKVTLQDTELRTVSTGELLMQDISTAQIINLNGTLYAYVHAESGIRNATYREVTAVHNLERWEDGSKI